MMGCVLHIRPVPFHLQRYIRLFVPQVERRNLCFVWVCAQIVGFVVLCEFSQRFFNSCFNFYGRGLMSCDMQIVCVYEATCFVVEMLVISVDVEFNGKQDTSLWQAILLLPPSATLIVQFHTDPTESIFWITLHSGLSCVMLLSFCIMILWFTVS